MCRIFINWFSGSVSVLPVIRFDLFTRGIIIITGKDRVEVLKNASGMDGGDTPVSGKAAACCFA